jgi:Fur family ferric uptake transcriptional regulator
MAEEVELSVALRARGMRMTHQREQVLAVVRRLEHATPDEISAELEGVDLTTVYRTLQLLEDLALVAHTHLGHGAPSFRPAGDQHIHVVCHECGSVIDAPHGLVDSLAAQLFVERGFTVDLAHFTIFGQCADCSRTPPEHRHLAHHHGGEQTEAHQR